MANFDAKVAELRQGRYHQGEAERLTSAQQVLEFVNQVGYCLFLPCARLDLPNLADIASGRFYKWKDELFTHRLAYYGRLFHRRAGFVALDLLPALYALSPTAEVHGDRFELYRNRYLSADGNRIAGVVLAKGPLPTRALRRESGLAGESQRYRLVRALVEAESRFLIARAEMTAVEETRYTYLWDTFSRCWPAIPDQSAGLSIETAATTLITRYVQTTAAATTKKIAFTFMLNEQFVRYMADRLTAASAVGSISDGGVDYLVSHELLALL